MSRPRLAPVAHVLLGIVATLAFAEGLLRLLPVQDGVFAGEADPRWPVQHWAPDRDYTWSSGWHFANRVQGRINGRRFNTEQWKLMFLHAYSEERGVEIKYLPALNRAGMVPCGRSSSDLSVGEMSELMDFISAWGAENNIKFHDQEELEEA